MQGGTGASGGICGVMGTQQGIQIGVSALKLLNILKYKYYSYIITSDMISDVLNKQKVST